MRWLVLLGLLWSTSGWAALCPDLMEIRYVFSHERMYVLCGEPYRVSGDRPVYDEAKFLAGTKSQVDTVWDGTLCGVYPVATTGTSRITTYRRVVGKDGYAGIAACTKGDAICMWGDIVSVLNRMLTREPRRLGDELGAIQWRPLTKEDDYVCMYLSSFERIPPFEPEPVPVATENPPTTEGPL